MSDRTTVTITVNGVEHTREIESRTLLVHFLREELGLTGTHIGCDTSSCGACTILLDGVPALSCSTLAAQADGHAVRTVEGLAADGELHPVQQAFHEEHGLQCGFCTPGMMMAVVGLIEANADPSEDEIRAALEGNLCRCTGYQNIVRAAQKASRRTARA